MVNFHAGDGFDLGSPSSTVNSHYEEVLMKLDFSLKPVSLKINNKIPPQIKKKLWDAFIFYYLELCSNTISTRHQNWIFISSFFYIKKASKASKFSITAYQVLEKGYYYDKIYQFVVLAWFHHCSNLGINSQKIGSSKHGMTFVSIMNFLDLWLLILILFRNESVVMKATALKWHLQD